MNGQVWGAAWGMMHLAWGGTWGVMRLAWGMVSEGFGMDVGHGE